MRMLVVAATVDLVSGGGEEDIALLHAREIGRAPGADLADVEAPLIGLESQEIPERWVLGAGDRYPERGKARVFTVVHVFEEMRDHIHGENVRDLVVGIVA